MAVNFGNLAARLRGEYVAPSDEEPIAPMPEKPGLASSLETVTGKAVAKLGEILDVPLDRDDNQFGSILRAQTAAANTALTTQVRVDESSLRRQQLDRLPALIAECNRIAAELPPMPKTIMAPKDDRL